MGIVHTAKQCFPNIGNRAQFYPIVIACLLLLLSASYAEFYTSLTVFIITFSVTYTCFILNIQLELESVFHYIARLRPQAQPPERHLSQSINKSAGLTALPTPLANIMRKFVDATVRDFIQTWYVTIGPEEQEFLAEVRLALQ
jgi:hypothetical protein